MGEDRTGPIIEENGDGQLVAEQWQAFDRTEGGHLEANAYGQAPGAFLVEARHLEGSICVEPEEPISVWLSSAEAVSLALFLLRNIPAQEVRVRD